MIRIDPAAEPRLLIVADLERLGPIVRDGFAPALIEGVGDYLSGIAEIPRAPTRAVLVGVDSTCRRLDSAVRAMRDVAGDARLIFCCEPAFESWGRRAVQQGADDYLIFPPPLAELERALQFPARRTRDEWVQRPPADERPAASELELLSELINGGDLRGGEQLARMAAIVRAAVDATSAAVLLDGAIGTGSADGSGGAGVSGGAGSSGGTGSSGGAGVPPVGPVSGTGGTPVPPNPNWAAVASPSATDSPSASERDAGLHPASDAVLAEAILLGEKTIGQIRVGPGRRGAYGADDCRKLRHYATLFSRLLEQGDRTRRWRELAYRDELSGLPNRRYLLRYLDDALQRAERDRTNVTVLVFDIDDFKKYNDHYGHDAGDAIIRETGQLFLACCRKHDVVCRYGGDEFVVVFSTDERPRTSGSHHPQDVIGVLQRFRAALASHAFSRLGPEAAGRLTISGGLASFPWQARTAEELLTAADRALMEAKSGGKNRFWLVGSGDVADGAGRTGF